MSRFAPLVAVAIAVLGLGLSGTSAMAATEVTRTQSLDVTQINAIQLKAAIGRIRVEQGAGDTIEVQVTLKAKRTTGFLGSLPDVDKIDMTAITRGDELTFEVDAKNVEEDWLVRLPKKMLSAIGIKLGVGDVLVNGQARRVEVDLGIGDANLDVPSGAIELTIGTGEGNIKTKLANAGSITGKTGIGSVALDGVNGSVKTATLGGNLTAQGKGREPIEATVGVGDLSVKLVE